MLEVVEDGDGRLEGQDSPTQDDRDEGVEGVVRRPGNLCFCWPLGGALEGRAGLGRNMVGYMVDDQM